MIGAVFKSKRSSLLPNSIEVYDYFIQPKFFVSYSNKSIFFKIKNSLYMEIIIMLF